MKLFNKLMSKIFGGGSAAQASTASTAPSASTQPAAGSSGNTGTTTMPAAGASGGMTAASGGTTAASGGTTAAPATVDVNAVLNEMASKNSEKLDWKKSIVDLMKLVGMDSSLSARKELATELGYTGNKDDSATMNIWLHKQVLRKLAENGGKVPQNLLD
jgi:hypothetical protein